jgi:hypothetical protein
VAKALFSPHLLHDLLELPDSVEVVGAETVIDGFENQGPLIALHIEGEDIPAGLVMLNYSRKPAFDSFDPVEGERIQDGRLVPKEK